MHSAPITLSLTDHAGWSVAAAEPHDRAPDGVIAATVPGCIHTDLLGAGLIPDPFVDSNELDVAWVAGVDWIYSTTFRMTEAMTAHDHVTLVMEGLDTIATIEVNGVVVGETANMHRSYRIDIAGAVREGVNRLSVAFVSATRQAEELRAHDEPWPSASFDRPYNYLRKMACSWGWDWGPSLTTCGIWKAARIECASGPRLLHVRPAATIDDHDRGTVSISVVVQSDDSPTRVRAVVVDPGGVECAGHEWPPPGGGDASACSLEVGHVQRWWPHTHGSQPLYRVDVTLVDGDGRTLDTWSRRIGFRSLQLDTAPDATGSAFTFVVNGRPVFARGVNWIPEDPFPSWVTPARVRERLTQARDANVDLVRVWGGGLYESDDFYDTCDELGLMVWQDFCFACAAYPEPLLAAEVEAEARDNVERLMAHPSLVLWNGNNENIWGWFDWGWQRAASTSGRGEPVSTSTCCPASSPRSTPARPYWPGSPYSGSMRVAANADAYGCVHVWDVWNALDFDRYRDHAPRFVSEFGWQAPPTWNTLRTAISDDPLTPESPGMLHHQKADRGNHKLARGLRAHVGVPDEFDAWWWATQLMQARAVTTGIEHFRSLRGHCMGTIWWQLNDCWPVTSWAVVDSGGVPKPAWYALRDAYRPRLLTVQPRGDELVLFAINDSDSPWEVTGAVRRTAFNGDTRATASVELAVPAGAIASLRLPAAIATPDRADAELVVVDAGGERALWWFLADRDLALERPRLTIGSTVCGCGDRKVSVLAHNLVRDLTIFPDRVIAGATSDRQLVTLLPDETATFVISGADGATVSQLTEAPACWSAHAAVTAAAAVR